MKEKQLVNLYLRIPMIVEKNSSKEEIISQFITELDEDITYKDLEKWSTIENVKKVTVI